MKTLITRKLGMTSTISEDGAVRPVTLLSSEEHTVTQIKTIEKDGYNAVQVGTGTTKKLNKAQVGHYKAAKVLPKVTKEIRINETDETQVSIGDKISADIFSVGDKINVTSTSKGKGFAGTIKRHNFQRGRKTHGGRSYRRPGSIGSMYPQKIFKGKKMSGHMGHEQVTIQNLEVALVDMDSGVIGVYGAVPGPRKTVVVIRGNE